MTGRIDEWMYEMFYSLKGDIFIIDKSSGEINSVILFIIQTCCSIGPMYVINASAIFATFLRRPL